MNDLHSRLSNLPTNECSYEYELELNKIISYLDNNNINDLRSIIANKNLNEATRYGAFYCLATVYRHKLDSKEYFDLLATQPKWEKKHDSRDHLAALYYLIPPYKACNEEILEQEFKLANKHSHMLGYKHAFAELFATFCEQEQPAEDIKKRWGTTAERLVKDVINESTEDYAKYHCTLGRILAIQGNLNKAEDELKKAIQLEDSKRKDYALVIGQYQYFRLSIQAKKLLDTSEIQKQVDHLQKSIVSNVEIITFFTGVISFVIGSISLTKGTTTIDAILLIVALMGALLFVFSSFCCLLRLPRKKRFILPYLAYSVLGIIIIIAALGAAYYFHR